MHLVLLLVLRGCAAYFNLLSAKINIIILLYNNNIIQYALV